LLDRRKPLAVEKIPELARQQKLLANKALVCIRPVSHLRHVVRQASLAAYARTLADLGLGLRQKHVVVCLADLLQLGDADVGLLQHSRNKLQCARRGGFPAKMWGTKECQIIHFPQAWNGVFPSDEQLATMYSSAREGGF
tara:strand:- start:4239 stop:4658 length:420 start_codon:yes stop_codon:yes gene_type:complete